MFYVKISFFLFKLRFLIERIKSNKLKKRIKKFDNNELINFKKLIKEKNFTTYWFLNNLKLFSFFFPKNKKEVFNYLEIGSFEGMSALYVADKFKLSNIVCVDTWSNSSKESQILNFDFNGIEKNFDNNLSSYNFIKIKDTSTKAFENNLELRSLYDYIYIDGSHDGEDIYFDATNCFKILKKNGVMIFDDISSINKSITLQPFKAFEKFYEENYKHIKILYLKRLAIIRKIT
tara:strand:+ start:901 stop:1599 length:699 start_codon:yes stop_codon:yes gene_type:complete